MKLVFVGPTLRKSDLGRLAGHAELRPPAGQGDIARATREGANVIGLVDGVYENVPSVWHKELLFALSRGVQVFGAASLGALRAAECADFGMVGIGGIFEEYRSGRRLDDGDVALLHAPAELDHAPLTLPLVNVDATLAAMTAAGVISPAEGDALAHAAGETFFKDRTLAALVMRVACLPPGRQDEIAGLFADFLIDRKRSDALLLVERIISAEDRRNATPPAWTLNLTEAWGRSFDRESLA